MLMRRLMVLMPNSFPNIFNILPDCSIGFAQSTKVILLSELSNYFAANIAILFHAQQFYLANGVDKCRIVGCTNT